MIDEIGTVALDLFPRSLVMLKNYNMKMQKKNMRHNIYIHYLDIFFYTSTWSIISSLLICTLKLENIHNLSFSHTVILSNLHKILIYNKTSAKPLLIISRKYFMSV